MNEVAIIGGGPAGIAVAIQLKRYGIPFILFEKFQLGGMLKNANLVENYPGFPQGIPGPALVSLFKEQLLFHHVESVKETILAVDFDAERDAFMLTGDHQVYSVKIVVAACGTLPRTEEMVEHLPFHLKQRIFYEVFPIAHEKGCRILIVGAGDAAFDYALNLSITNEVMIINRSHRVKALPLLVERIKSVPSVNYLENTITTNITGGKSKRMAVTLQTGDDSRVEEFDYAIFALGREPNRDVYTSSLMVSKEEIQRLGIYYEIGDMSNYIFRQTSIAIGNGIKTAMKIYQSLRRPGGHF